MGNHRHVARADGFVASMLAGVPMPRLALLRQKFDDAAVGDVAAEVLAQLARCGALARVKAGMTVAITGGSRGIADYALLVRTVAGALKARGAKPFVIPAMGSHGGATAQGQRKVLAGFGITEAAVGCPIVSSLDTVRVGTTARGGLPVFADAAAWAADGIVLLNRIKCHTGFRGPFESGLVKMIAIGLGKQKGADTVHSLGFERIARTIVSVGRVVLRSGKVLFGVGTVENAYDRICRVAVIPAERILAEEPLLLEESKKRMPSLPVEETDVLVVGEIGKDVSGGGMDSNVVGRFVTPGMKGGFRSRRLVVLDVTDESEGNAIGLGRADLATQRAFDKADFEQMYPNALTSHVLDPSRIPVILANDRLAIAAAIKTCVAVDPADIRLMHIRNSLDIEKVRVTANLVDAALRTGRCELLREPAPMRFDSDGNLR